jgi:hypothetical protein
MRKASSTVRGICGARLGSAIMIGESREFIRHSGHDHCRASAAVTCCSLAKPSVCTQSPILPRPALRCAASAARNCSAVSCWRDSSNSPSGMR